MKSFAVPVLACVAIAIAAGWASAQEDPLDPEVVAAGQGLYIEGCASCHGASGAGVVDADGDERGPSLLESGEAAAFYYLSTGRMPLADSDDQPRRKEPAYDEVEIDALVAFVGSLGAGPPRPVLADLEAADLALGGELFRGNCQACHTASGGGAALSYGSAAPSLHPADPLEIASAVRAGPGQMPVFDDDAFDDAELVDLVAYVRYLRDPADPGGLPLGRTGPIPEGLVAWLVGITSLLLCAMWIGSRQPAVTSDEDEDA